MRLSTRAADIAAVLAPFFSELMESHDVSQLINEPEFDSADSSFRSRIRSYALSSRISLPAHEPSTSRALVLRCSLRETAIFRLDAFLPIANLARADSNHPGIPAIVDEQEHSPCDQLIK